MKTIKLWRVITKPKKASVKKRKPPVLVAYERVTAEQRFHNNYVVVPSGCWEWSSKLDRYGYGKFIFNGRLVKAHRYSFELFNGPFDPKLHVVHRCDNPCCVNPEHLFLGTNRDNILDRMQKNRSRTAYKKLTVEEKQAIVELLKTRTLIDVAKEYGADVRTIRKLYQNSDSAKTA